MFFKKVHVNVSNSNINKMQNLKSESKCLKNWTNKNNKNKTREFPTVQWLGLHTFTAKSAVSSTAKKKKEPPKNQTKNKTKILLRNEKRKDKGCFPEIYSRH